MKPFHFPLKSLRVLREQKERAAQKRYVDALRASNEAAATLDVGTYELATAWTTLCEEASEGTIIAKLHQSRAWCSELERRCDQLSAALKVAQQQTHEAWVQMTLATRDRESVDKLRDKCLKAFDRAVQRNDQKIMDEIALNSGDLPITSFQFQNT